MMELHVRRQDLEIEWLDEGRCGWSPPGCRVTHIASGVAGESRMFGNRQENRRTAMYVLAQRMLSLGADRVVVESSNADPIVAG